MKNPEYYKDKKITIVGFARSGLACANLLFSLGADVRVTDNKDNELLRANLLKLKSKAIKVELGAHSQEFIKDRDLLIVSPGVPNDALPIYWAKQFGVPAISEIELAWSLCPATIIAITGSNGKTTVTTLIGRVLEAAGLKAFVCGNIGNPFCAEIEKMGSDDYVSLEISSFQLEGIVKFKPKISLILNFTSNHLDRYKNMQEYFEAKKRIFINQDGSDFLVLNSNDPALANIAKEAKTQVAYFSGTKDLNPNQSAVMCVASLLNIDKGLVIKVLKEFIGIEHRMETVTEINKITFINDSKATTADSAIWALSNINSPIILIAGGKDKGIDYSVILDLARKKVKQAILIGEAKEKIAAVLKGKVPVYLASDLKEAVSKAYSKAIPGDCVLFSPMCSSFDMFTSYEERGRAFKKICCAISA